MKTRLLMIWMAAALLACSGGEGKGDPWKFPADAGGDAGNADAGGDAGIDAGGGGGHPVTFRLQNDGRYPVFAYPFAAGNACGSGAWIEVLEGDTAHRLVSDCIRCACDDPQCNVCAIDCAPGVSPQAAQISAGGERVFEWDGLLRVDDVTTGGAQCESLRAPTRDTLTARFCWARGYQETFDGWGDLTGIECEDVEFARGDAVVEFTIPSLEPPEPIQFELRNITDQMRYAHISAGGGCDTGRWLSMSQGDRPVEIVDACGVCSCTAVNDPNMCPQPCPGAPCAAPTREMFELPPGGVRVHNWSRVAYYDDTVDGAMCRWDRFATGEMVARFCWAWGIDDSLTFVDERCTEIVFDASEATAISHEISE